jgi:membrane-associated phospholipid phosphatase
VRKLLFILFSGIVFCVNAQVRDATKNNVADSVKHDFTAPDSVQHLHSKLISYVPPTILAAYGFSSFVIKPVRNIDYYFRMRVARSDPNYGSKVDDYLQIAPIVIVYGLNLAGDEGKDRFIDRTAILALSGGILTVTDGLKYIMHRVRPYGTDPLSFPSGHTGAAFLAAEFLAQEYSWKSPLYGVLGYTLATTTGIMRIYSRAHWFSDVVAGAGFGILSTKAAYALYPLIRNALTHHGKHGRSTMFMPSLNYGAPGLTFAASL